MTSITLPVIGFAVSIAAAVLVLALCAVTGFGVWQLRVVLPRRIKLLEDALRVYNGANATLGCRIVELETALQRVRAVPLVPDPAEAPAPPRGLQTAAQRYGTATAGAPAAVAVHPQPNHPPSQTPPAQAHSQQQPLAQAPRPVGAHAGAASEFSEAELRLAQLIKSRLSSLRAH